MKAANKNTIPITSESDILCAFRNLTSSYDERTLHKWINFFKKCMYYASSDYSNPMFLSLTYNAVKKSLHPNTIAQRSNGMFPLPLRLF